ncbi:hypothetical protein OMK64_01850 [Cellulomonas fimi]|uniref:hypothetical protein n=1 Tax=Cellulomonas fimi TaxID=1708 RepID=UPI00234C970F|nr:hypothetical protein [Cellulomonas fimi]MDC7120276.1 hypothetical protein [Cellulomonas fimi]
MTTTSARMGRLAVVVALATGVALAPTIADSLAVPSRESIKVTIDSPSVESARTKAERQEAERLAHIEAARVAAEQAAGEAAAVEAARIAAHPEATRGAASAVEWTTWVANSGGQDAVDACTGGLTRWFEPVDGKTYLPVHRECGGLPILDLQLGDRVLVDGATYVVTDARDVRKGDSYEAAAGLDGLVLVQTCYPTGGRMRLVALTPA